MTIKKNGLYRHYKGNNYLLLDVVRHSETLEEMVFYKCLYENELGDLWVRPLSMFIENVTIDGKEIPRFEYIGDHKGKDRL
ncbi:MAG: DUF1653 domain-containing protein [Bacteriovoracaceae bacterium]|nr:DUF1653 domain-containing protein [Bacteriovoracaceae bacterium]